MAVEVSHDPDGGEEPDSSVRSRRISRRVILRSGTLGAAAAGVVAAVPGLGGLLQTASTVAPAAPEVASDAGEAAPVLEGPIVAHITDAASGELSLYFGEQEVSTRDPALVQRLLRLAR